MDIEGLSMAMSNADIVNQMGAALLKNSLDNIETMGDGMQKIMEASVTPYLGQNIDYSV